MIITRTPLRVSIYGGSTDIKSWFETNGGLCVGLAIDKYVYVTCKKLPHFYDYNYKLVYSKTEETNIIEEIEHPSIRECLQLFKKEYGIDDPIEIHNMGDIPARTGTGSSSSFLVGLINGLNHLYKIKSSNHDMASLANHIEREILKEAGGYQDPIWAAYGGLNTIEFKKSDGPFSCFQVKQIDISDGDYDYLEKSLVLFYTGLTRNAHEVTQTYKRKNTEQKALVDIAKEGARAIKQLDVQKMGKLLHENWMNKKALSTSISTSETDDIYELGLKNGAFGGKVIGAGGGGCFLFVVAPEHRQKFLEKMKGLLHIDFKIDFEGSKKI